ncbi:MAG: hypothetical protein RIC15_08645 [Vicingaceae bacterium]
MKNLIVLFIVHFLFSLFAVAQPEGSIIWNEKRPLVWDDFMAAAPEKHMASAMSDVSFTVNLASDGDMLNVYIAAGFNPANSWVKQDDKDNRLLKHEQLHFDIYEVNARLLREELKKKKLSLKNAQSEINKLMDKYNKLNSTTQVDYDKETEHSIDRDKQEKWEEKIAEKLKNLSEHRSARFNIPILTQ